MIFELIIGGAVAGVLFWLQDRTSKKVEINTDEIQKMTKRIDKFTLDKSTREQAKKKSQIDRIIYVLDFLNTKEGELRDFIKPCAIDDSFKEMLRFTVSANFNTYLTSYRIVEILDACRLLEDLVNDNSLLLDVRKDSDQFMLLADKILVSNMPKDESERKQLLILLEMQLSKIQEFLTRFRKELEPE